MPAARADMGKAPLAILGGMYDALTDFLQDFSSRWPLLWALSVMAVVAGTGLGLYVLWELVLGWAIAAWAVGRARSNGRG